MTALAGWHQHTSQHSSREMSHEMSHWRCPVGNISLEIPNWRCPSGDAPSVIPNWRCPTEDAALEMPQHLSHPIPLAIWSHPFALLGSEPQRTQSSISASQQPDHIQRPTGSALCQPAHHRERIRSYGCYRNQFLPFEEIILPLKNTKFLQMLGNNFPATGRVCCKQECEPLRGHGTRSRSLPAGFV